MTELATVRIVRALLASRYRGAIKDLCDQAFGVGYFESLPTGDFKSYFVNVALDKKDVRGFCLYGIAGENSGKLLRSFRGDCDAANTGVFKTVAVDREHQRRGIGLALSCDAVIHMDKLGAPKILATAWIKKYFGSDATLTPAQHLLRKIGFKEIRTDWDYWKDECCRRVFDCPHRTLSANGCGCGQTLYTYDFGK